MGVRHGMAMARGQSVLWKLIALTTLCVSIAHGVGVPAVFISLIAVSAEDSPEDANGKGEFRSASPRRSGIRVLGQNELNSFASYPLLADRRESFDRAGSARSLAPTHLIGAGIQIRC